MVQLMNDHFIVRRTTAAADSPSFFFLSDKKAGSAEGAQTPFAPRRAPNLSCA